MPVVDTSLETDFILEVAESNEDKIDPLPVLLDDVEIFEVQEIEEDTVDELWEAVLEPTDLKFD